MSIENAKKQAESYTEFRQSQKLAELGVAEEERLGVCLSLCFSWIRGHATNPKRSAADRLGDLTARLRDIKREQEGYSEEQARVRELATYAGKMASVARIMGEQGYDAEADTLVEVAGERMQRLMAVTMVDVSGVKTPYTLLKFAREKGIRLTEATRAEIDFGKGAIFINLAAKLKTGKYWLISLGTDHAICVYTYTHVIWSDYILCFDPNFGEFKVPFDHMKVAFFFLYLLSEAPEYQKYKAYTLYRASL